MEKDVCFPDLFYRQRLNAVGIPMLLSVSLFALFSDAALVLFFVGIVVLPFAFLATGERRKILLCVLVGISLALFTRGICGMEEKRMEKYLNESVFAQGYVVKTSENSFDLALVKMDEKPFYKTFRVESEEEVRQGEKIRLILTVTEIAPEKDRSEGIFCLATAESKREKIGKSLLFSLVSHIRQPLLEAFSGEDEGGFLSAILLGDKSGISSLKASFSKTASQHILAISGLHVSQFIGFFVIVLNLFPISRRVTRILLFPLVGILFLLGGGGISVFRAGFMTLFSLLALLARRRADSVTSLVMAASVLVFLSPYTVENYSFLFSFLSTFALVSCAVPLSEYYALRIVKIGERANFFEKILIAIVSSFTISSAVFVFLLPLQIMLMGNVQLFSPIYALILIPLFQVCLIAALLGALLVFLPFSVPFLSEGVLLVQKAFLTLVTALADAAPPLVELGKWSVPTALFFACVLLLFFVRKEKLSRIHLLHFASIFAFGFLYLFLL